MDAINNHLLALRRGLFASINVVAQKCWFYASQLCKLSHIDFRVCKKEPLQFGRLGVFISETFKTYVLIKIPPMNPVKTEDILTAFIIRCGS